MHVTVMIEKQRRSSAVLRPSEAAIVIFSTSFVHMLRALFRTAAGKGSRPCTCRAQPPTTMPSPRISRRHALLSAAGLAAAPLARSQAHRSAAGTRQGGALVTQIVDTSAAQQDVSKDLLIGSRAAWQDINARGGLRGRPVQHQTLETDGSPAGLRAALQTVRENPACLALTGTAGAAAASQLSALLRQEPLDIAHAAPWLQNAGATADRHTFPIFAPRQEQIAHALKSLSSMGVAEVGAIYASAQEQSLYREDVERTAAALKLKLHSYGGADPRALGQRLTPGTPAILLYIGGTPELVQFTQGLEKQLRQRYVVALADVNLQTLQQLGAARQTPVIATQPVPLVSASLPVVRAYRETLARLFDEPPSPLSLAGFIAARYTFEVLRSVEGPLTRQSALAAFSRRAPLDLGGFRISFDAQGRGSGYVTQSMLTTDGRVVG